MTPPAGFSFFFNDSAPTEIYTLSLHDALPIYGGRHVGAVCADCLGTRDRELVDAAAGLALVTEDTLERRDRKSTRLNSSHATISYADFCLKKQKEMHAEYGQRSAAARPSPPQR